MQFRPVPETHEAAVSDLIRYAFVPQRGPGFDDDPPERPAELGLRGLYDVPSDASVSSLSPAALRAVCGSYDFRLRLRGDFHRVGGLTLVASPPETRRTGHVRTLVEAYHGDLADRGVAVSALWPFEHGFYRRLGYATTNTAQTTDLPPTALSAVVPEPAGEFRRLSAADAAAMAAVHEAASPWTLTMRRSEDWWRLRVCSSWDGPNYVYGWESAGELRGYLVYRITGEGDDRTMAVRELVAHDGAARGQLLRFCRDHDSQVSTVRLHGPPDDRLLYELDDPTEATVERHAGPMLRFVDLPAAVAALSFPADASGSVVVEVEDPAPPGGRSPNEGTWRIEVAEGRACCARTDEPPAVTGAIGPVSLLLVGARDAAALRTTADLSTDDGTAARLDRLFPASPTFLREWF